jgi:hypothetical protein
VQPATTAAQVTSRGNEDNGNGSSSTNNNSTSSNNNNNTTTSLYNFAAHLTTLLRLLREQGRRAHQGKLLRVGHAPDELLRRR